MSGSFENLIFELKDGVGLVTVNRPDKLNALNRKTFEELDALLDEAAKDPSVGVIVITGSGQKAFVAGADIGELVCLDPLGGRETSSFGQAVFSKVESFPKPVIAAVNGFALGGGCELAMACHMRIASENAQFGQPEVNLGLLPGYGGTQRLARLVGRGVAMEMLLTAERISAERAFQLGLVNHVVPQSELLPKAMEIAGKALQKSASAIAFCIEAVNGGADMPMGTGLFLESTLFGLACGSADMKEGTAAFMEKRKPGFKSR